MGVHALTKAQKRTLSDVLRKFPTVISVIKDITQKDGRAYLVGGAVRDLILKRPLKDLDIEVHNLSLEQLTKLLQAYGPVDMVGKSFGVVKLYTIPIDWSLPRTDSAGRKPRVEVDPTLSIDQALERRDVTMNAMAIDLKNYTLHDPFDGLLDIKNKLLRSPNPSFFTQDPLRFFRVMQFIARFEMEPNETLNKVCSTMSLKGISRERIEEEMKKLLLLSKRPSLGLRWIKKINRMHAIFPELDVLSQVVQDTQWHPEGDVFEHTMQAVDAVARLSVENEYEKLILLYGALCHDLGKATTTTIDNDGRIRSNGHDVAGVPIAHTLLKRITYHADLIKTVELLVRYHMAPGIFVKEGAQPAAYKRLARKLAPYTTLEMLGLLAYADKQGRNGKGHEPLKRKDPFVKQFLKNARALNISQTPEPPLINGRDLIPDIPAGPLLGKILKEVYRIQIEENIIDKEVLKKKAKDLYKNCSNIH